MYKQKGGDSTLKLINVRSSPMTKYQFLITISIPSVLRLFYYFFFIF